MESVLNVEVSWFDSHKATAAPKRVNVLYWLTHRSAVYDVQVDKIRSTTDDATRKTLKSGLIGFTPHGIFSYRDAKHHQQHSRLICLDLDEKDNRHLEDFHQMKTHLSQLPEVAYCGLSVSGNGYFVLIPIAYPEQHEKQFDALVERFAEMNINVDKSGRNLDRFRYYSYDPAPYINEQAKRFTGFPRPKRSTSKTHKSDYRPSDSETTQSKVEDVINQLRQRKADITSDPRQWFEIGCALANEFGENGREYYHDVSQFYPDYQPEKTDKRFDYALTKRYNYSIGTFFKLCADAGFVPELPDRSASKSIPLTRPNAITKPVTSAIIERLIVDPCNTYPPEWDSQSSTPAPVLTTSTNQPLRYVLGRCLNLIDDAVPLYQLTHENTER